MDTTEFKMPPKNSSMYALIQGIIAQLFVAEERRIKSDLHDIIVENNKLRGCLSNRIMHEGNSYVSDKLSPAQVNTKTGTPPTHDDIVPKMEAYVRDVEKLALDKRQIAMVIYRLTDKCESLQELRNALPECMVPMIRALAEFQRTAEPGDNLKDDPRIHKQIMEIMPTIKFYSAARLMY